MTYTELKSELLSRIDPAYSSNTTYQGYANAAFLNALRSVLLSASEIDFPGFVLKITNTASAAYNISSVKAAGIDLIRIIRVVDTAGTQYVEKNVSDFYDPILTPVAAFENFYCVTNKQIIFKASCTADIYYFGVPSIQASDDMGQFISQYGIEQVTAVALPMLDAVIRGAE